MNEQLDLGLPGMPECVIYVGGGIKDEVIDVRAEYLKRGFQEFPPTITVPGWFLYLHAQAGYSVYPWAGPGCHNRITPEQAVIVRHGDRFIDVPPAAY